MLTLNGHYASSLYNGIITIFFFGWGGGERNELFCFLYARRLLDGTYYGIPLSVCPSSTLQTITQKHFHQFP